MSKEIDQALDVLNGKAMNSKEWALLEICEGLYRELKEHGERIRSIEIALANQRQNPLSYDQLYPRF